MSKIKLSKVERIILANQFRILAALEPDSAIEHQNRADCLQSGYLEQASLERYVEDELAHDVHELVYDTLDMFQALKDAKRKILELKKITIKFPGFDEKKEAKYLAYSRHLIERDVRFSDCAKDGPFATHSEMVETYEKMTKKWRSSSDRFDLDLEDVRRIAEASRGTLDLG